MAIWDFLQSIGTPIRDLGQNIGNVAEQLVPGAGKLGEALHTAVPQSIASDVADILPYAATMGLDNKKLPEILSNIREQRQTAAIKKQKAEQDSVESFITGEGYNIAPAALPQLTALIKANPQLKPADIISKGKEANWITPKPILKTITMKGDIEDLAKDYTGLTDKQLQEQFLQTTDPTHLAAIQKAASLKKATLYSAASLAEKAARDAEARQRAEDKRVAKEEKEALKLEEKTALSEKEVVLPEKGTIPVLGNVPFIYQGEEKVKTYVTKGDNQNILKIKNAVAQLKAANKFSKNSILGSSEYKALTGTGKIYVDKYLERQ